MRNGTGKAREFYEYRKQRKNDNKVNEIIAGNAE